MSHKYRSKNLFVHSQFARLGATFQSCILTLPCCRILTSASVLSLHGFRTCSCVIRYGLERLRYSCHHWHLSRALKVCFSVQFYMVWLYVFSWHTSSVWAGDTSLSVIMSFSLLSFHLQKKWKFWCSAESWIGSSVLSQIGLHHPSSVSAQKILACQYTQGCLL